MNRPGMKGFRSAATKKQRKAKEKEVSIKSLVTPPYILRPLSASSAIAIHSLAQHDVNGIG